jgi:flagellar hook-associated protein 1 FlgK
VKVRNKTASIGSSVDAMGIPYYQSQMNQFIRSFAVAFNDIMYGGDNYYGDKVDFAFFTGTDPDGKDYNLQNTTQLLNNGTTVSSDDSSYYKMTAENFCVNNTCVKDAKTLATTKNIEGDQVDAYDIASELAKLKSNTILYRNGTADGFLKCIISDISIDTQETKIYYQNYYNISENITNQRMSVSGVDQDEEGLDLVKFQNAYNLSSKMVSVMAEIYDRLILETGV